jgi:MYXO-CTERM domain-containing protein
MVLMAATDPSERTNIYVPEHPTGLAARPEPCGSESSDGGGGDSSNGCNTTGSVDDSSTSTTIAGIFAASGLVALRLRRRRPRAL